MAGVASRAGRGGNLRHVFQKIRPCLPGEIGVQRVWQAQLGIDYPDVEWAATGERLTASTFAEYRKQHGIVIVHMIPEEVVTAAITSPLTFIASDARMQNGHGHPRSAGTFARVHMSQSSVTPRRSVLSDQPGGSPSSGPSPAAPQQEQVGTCASVRAARARLVAHE